MHDKPFALVLHWYICSIGLRQRWFRNCTLNISSDDLNLTWW